MQNMIWTNYSQIQELSNFAEEQAMLKNRFNSWTKS